MKSSVMRSFLKPRAGASADEPARSRTVLLLVLGAFVAGTLFMQVIPQLKAKADSAASLPKSGPANLEDRLDSLEKEQQVYVGQTRKLRGMLGSLLCNIEGTGSEGSSCLTKEQSSIGGDHVEAGFTQALADLSAKKRALPAWQDATSAATGSAIFTRPNRRGSLGGEIASSPKVNVVTMEMCGLDSTSLEKALKGAPDFASGSR